MLSGLLCEGTYMHGSIPIARLRSNPPRPTSRPKFIDPQPVAFGDLARFAYPLKTIEALGHITGAGRSTIKDWLNGSHSPPHWALAIVLAEVMRRLATR